MGEGDIAAARPVYEGDEQGVQGATSPAMYRRLMRAASSYASFQIRDGDDDGDKSAWGRIMHSGKPVVCILILLVCTVMLLVEIGANGWKFEDFKVNPTLGPSPDVLLDLGAKRTDLIIEEGQTYRLVAPIFLHGGVLHYFFNMMGLYSIGFPLERQFGSPAVLWIFLLSGFMGVIMSAIFSPLVIGIGASGGIFGIFGASWAELIQNWSLYQGDGCSALTQLAFATVLNLMLGLMPFLDNFAHLGGFFTGMITGFGLLVSDRYTRFGEKKERKMYQICLQISSVLITPLLVVVALFVLYYGIGADEGALEWCDWCGYLSCVPFPPGDSKWWTCDACTDAGVAVVGSNATHVTLQCPNRNEIDTLITGPLNTEQQLIDLCRIVC